MIAKIRKKLHNRACEIQSRMRCQNRVRFSNDKSIVTFSFDDFPASAYRTAGPILERYGFRGTYYTSMELAGVENEQGEHFSIQDLRSLSDAGHEIGCHTFNHRTSDEQSVDELDWSVSVNAEKIRHVVDNAKIDVFSCPKGVVRLMHQQSLAQHFRCIRTIRAGVNRGAFDLNHVRAVSLYEHHTDLAGIETLMAQLENEPGWLVFYTHDVQEHPSRYGITPGLFEQIVALVARSNVAVATTSQALDLIVGQESQRGF